MNTPLIVSAVAFAFIATAAPRTQRMGHSNTNAPELRQSIAMGGKATVGVTYTAITWANGTWSKALSDASKRQRVRESINAAASERPLGSLETTVSIMVGSQHVSEGSYKLSFGLDEQFQWELRLSGSQKLAIPLELVRGARERKRLTLNLNAGIDDNSAILHVWFGRMECELAVTPHGRQNSAKAAAITVNQRCPFMDEPVDPAETALHNGKLVGFCCEDCVEDWGALSIGQRDEKLAEAVSVKPSNAGGGEAVTVNAKCPIMGGEVEADGETASFEGKKIGFCCPGCKPKWEAWSKSKKAAFIVGLEGK